MTRNVGLVLSVFVIGTAATIVGQQQQKPTVEVYKSVPAAVAASGSSTCKRMDLRSAQRTGRIWSTSRRNTEFRVACTHAIRPL